MKKLLVFLSVMMVFSVMARHAIASSINVVSVTASSTYSGWNVDNIVLEANPVPIPGAVWLLGSGLIAMVGIRRKFKK